MNRGKQKVDRCVYEQQTCDHRSYIAMARRRLKQFDEDGDRKKRIATVECKFCYYFNSSRIGGATCTSGICGLCETVVHSGNTCLDKLCGLCAAERGLCRHCGGDLEDKLRRNVDFSQRAS